MHTMRIQTAGIATLSALALVVTSFGIVTSAEAQALQGPRFGENYLLPPISPVRARDVPGLAVNPANQDHIVEAEMDPINLQCDYNVSFDGGRTWRGGHLRSGVGPVPACNQNFDSGGYHHFNTGIVFGSGQNVYITFSVHRGDFNRPESDFRGGAGDDAVVARSTDGGRTFQPAVVAIPGGGPIDPNLQNPGLAGRGLRPQIAVERRPGQPDRLYVNSWHCVVASGGCSGGGGERRFLVARSDDGGATWNAPVVASRTGVRSGADATAAGSADEQTREPSQPVIGPDGAVYMAGRNRDSVSGNICGTSGCIVIYRSLDQGQTWQQFSTGAVTGSGHPRLAIDPSTPAGVGTLYVAYQRSFPAPTADSADIVLQRSTDRGQTWSPGVRVNDDPAGSTQTNAWPSVGPGGRVDVTWADRRHTFAGGGGLVDIYYASSTNNGTSFGANRRVTDRSINLATGLGGLGSYTWYGPVSLPLADGSILTAWQDSRLANLDTGYHDVYLSRMNPAAPIARKTIATATPPGLSVRLSQLAFPGGNEALGTLVPATRAVVASQGDPAGALAGAVLARANWGPLLLSPAGALPAFVKAESRRIKPEGAYVIGDTDTLSPAVSRALTETTRDGENVQRVAAAANVSVANTPAEIGRQVAELMRPLPGASTPAGAEAVIVNPATPEAAAGAALAASLKLPILFVDNRGTNVSGAVPPPTEQAISSLGIKKVLIIGGTGAVNQRVQDRFSNSPSDPTPANRGLGLTVQRVGGANQYDTSEAVVSESRRRGLPANVVYVADGARPTEGAALGAAVARLGGLMLLQPGASTATAEAVLARPLPDVSPALVDRLVGAIGTGGVDPASPAAPRQAPIGYPLPPATLAIAGCPPARTARNLITLSNANDTRNGTPRDDLIFAGAGNDTVDALAGDDCVDLGTGADRGQGGVGNDLVLGGLGRDRIGGLSGNDRLRGNLDNDRLDGGRGNDRVFGDQGHDVLFGSFGNDLLHGVAGNDRISAGRGRDRINGGAGRDRISAGSSNDRAAGDQGRDRINGNSGNDSLKGNSGADRLTGGSGRDRLSGGSGNDRISARDGRRDRINCGSGRDRVIADRIDRVARNCERVRRR